MMGEESSLNKLRKMRAKSSSNGKDCGEQTISLKVKDTNKKTGFS